MKRVVACIDASPCVNATADAAAWIAKKTGRELVLFQVLDYRPTSYHLGEIGGVIGFESNAMLLKELADLDEKQFQLAQQYSDELLEHMAKYIKDKFGLECTKIQRKGDFLEQAFDELNTDDTAVIGRLGENSAEKKKYLGTNVEGIIRGSKSSVLVVSKHFNVPKSFIFAYEYSALCQTMLKRVGTSDLLNNLTCHLVHVGELNGILDEPADYLRYTNMEVKTEYLYGNVATNLINYQEQYDVELMVMGAFSHSKLHQFFLGSTTSEIFKRSDVLMLVVR